MDIKKISELEEAQTLYEGCCFPIVQNEETKRVTFQTMSEKVREGLTDEIKASEQYVESKANEVKELVLKQPIIQNGTWWVWNDFERAYVNTQSPASGSACSVTSIKYQAGASATTAPTGTWENNPVTVPQGQYLWTKTTFSDNSVSYSVARQGVDGSGAGDMTKSAYDSTSAVENAGGIVAYVSAQVGQIESILQTLNSGGGAQ